MSDEKLATTTTTVGYFNPNSWPIYIEISELNLKCELKPNQFIRDRAGSYINDPVFEDYVQPKGLGRSTGEKEVPVNFVPRFVKTARPIHSVTQAQSFVRQSDGSVVPSYQQAPATAAPESPINKMPIIGMSVAKARELGFIGKPRIVPEDYGSPDSAGAPSSGKDLPGIKYSIESPPKLRTAAPLTPELMEADQDLSPQEAARRTVLQQSLSRASSTVSGDGFDPSRVRPAATAAPVHMRAKSEPTFVAASPVSSTKTAGPPQRILPRRIAAVVEEAPQSEPADDSGTIQQLQDGDGMPEPTLDTPQVPLDESSDGVEKRFVCAPDDKVFRYRSELERHVKRKYPKMLDELMKPYPLEG